MKFYSELFGNDYEAEDCVMISNMQQNYKYVQSGFANEDLVDIICGDNGRLVFVWKKSKNTKLLYELWCNREL